MKEFLKKTGWINVITSLAFAIIGIVLIANPEFALKVIATILGLLFIIIGGVKVVDYFAAKKESFDLYNYDLIFGIIAIVIGLVAIFYSNAMEFMFRLIVGIWIIYSGIIRLSLSIKLRNIKSNAWIPALIMAVIMIIAGLYVTFTQGALIITMGVIMLIYAIMDLIESAIFIKNVNEIL
jgi:uncharacterized membrane protein HdeD (DUF308 family)